MLELETFGDILLVDGVGVMLDINFVLFVGKTFVALALLFNEVLIKFKPVVVKYFPALGKIWFVFMVNVEVELKATTFFVNLLSNV